MTGDADENLGRVELLSRPGNFCVVQVDGRKSPGMVVQGDSMNALLGKLNGVAARLEQLGVDWEDDARGELDWVRHVLDEALAHYESQLDQLGLNAPYPQRQRPVIDMGED